MPQVPLERATNLLWTNTDRAETELTSKGGFGVTRRPNGPPAWHQKEGVQEPEQGQVSGKSVLKAQCDTGVTMTEPEEQHLRLQPGCRRDLHSARRWASVRVNPVAWRSLVWEFGGICKSVLVLQLKHSNRCPSLGLALVKEPCRKQHVKKVLELCFPVHFSEY